MIGSNLERNVVSRFNQSASLPVDIGSLLYITLVSVFHPDWQIRSNFRLRRSDNLHKDSHQNSWILVDIRGYMGP